MNDFTGSAASQADFIWKNAEDLWGEAMAMVKALNRITLLGMPNSIRIT